MEISQILEILGFLTGGAGLNYLFLWKTNRLKAKNEADDIGADVATKTFAMQKDQSEYLIEKLTQYQKDYYTLEDAHRERMRKFQEELTLSQREFSEIINKKCEELAVLRSKVTYLKGIRCYNTICQKRIRVNPNKKEKDELEEEFNKEFNSDGNNK